MCSTLLLALLAAPDAGTLLARTVTIEAKRSEVDFRRRHGVYERDVVVVRDSTTLRCDRLEVSYDAGGQVERVLASGNVVAVDGDRQAWGETADYDNRTGVLVVRGQPRGRQGTREITGETVTFATGTDTLLVTRPHTVTSGEPAGGGTPAVIDADTLTMVQSRATATWRGHVRVVRGPTVLTAPELDATWNAEGAITRLVAKGGVEAVEPTRRARGQRADFDVVKGVLVVTGRPEAHQGRNHMRGTRVTFFPESERVSVENAVTVIEQDPRGR